MNGILAIERNEVKLLSNSGISAGGTAYFRFNPGLRYHGLVVKYSGTLADYPELRVMANTETIRRVSFAEQDMMNQTDGLAAASGFLFIPFDSLGMRVREGEEETALNVGRPASIAEMQPNEITSAELQIDIAGSPTATPSLEIWATVSNALPGGAGLVRHIVKTNRPVQGAGEFDVQDLNHGKPNRAWLRRVFFKSEDMNQLEIYRENVKMFERTRAVNTINLSNGMRNQQSGWTLIDKCEDGYAGSKISTIGIADFRIRLGMTAAASNMPVITEWLGTLKA